MHVNPDEECRKASEASEESRARGEIGRWRGRWRGRKRSRGGTEELQITKYIPTGYWDGILITEYGVRVGEVCTQYSVQANSSRYQSVSVTPQLFFLIRSQTEVGKGWAIQVKLYNTYWSDEKLLFSLRGFLILR